MKSIYQLLGLASTQDVKDLAASVASAHERIVELEKAAESARTLVLRLDGRSNLFHDALARVDEVTESIQGKVDGLLDVDAHEEINSILDDMDIRELVDVDQLCDQVESNLDIDDIADRVKDTIAKPLGSDKIDHAVNEAIQREAPGIIGSFLKHIDWSEELTVDATIHSAR